jgi:hypothetical protein
MFFFVFVLFLSSPWNSFKILYAILTDTYRPFWMRRKVCISGCFSSHRTNLSRILSLDGDLQCSNWCSLLYSRIPWLPLNGFRWWWELTCAYCSLMSQLMVILSNCANLKALKSVDRSELNSIRKSYFSDLSDRAVYSVDIFDNCWIISGFLIKRTDDKHRWLLDFMATMLELGFDSSGILRLIGLLHFCSIYSNVLFERIRSPKGPSPYDSRILFQDMGLLFNNLHFILIQEILQNQATCYLIIYVIGIHSFTNFFSSAAMYLQVSLRSLVTLKFCSITSSNWRISNPAWIQSQRI